MTRSTDPGAPLQHRHDNKLDYTSEHTAADPGQVVREEYVANDDKALPSNKGTVLLLSVVSAVLAVVAIVLSFTTSLDWGGVIVAGLALLAGIVATFMAYHDARTGAGTPGLVTAVAAVVFVVVLMDALDAEDVQPGTLPGAMGVERAENEALDGDADLGPTNATPAND